MDRSAFFYLGEDRGRYVDLEFSYYASYDVSYDAFSHAILIFDLGYRSNLMGCHPDILHRQYCHIGHRSRLACLVGSCGVQDKERKLDSNFDDFFMAKVDQSLVHRLEHHLNLNHPAGECRFCVFLTKRRWCTPTRWCLSCGPRSMQMGCGEDYPTMALGHGRLANCMVHHHCMLFAVRIPYSRLGHQLRTLPH